MAHKRPFDDEVVDEGSSKHQKQENPMYLVNLALGNDELELRQVHGKSSCPVISRELVEEVENDAPRFASLSHWAISSTSDMMSS
ncbi:Peroxisome assembly protein 22 [Bienertia sinuspersici]